MKNPYHPPITCQVCGYSLPVYRFPYHQGAWATVCGACLERPRVQAERRKRGKARPHERHNLGEEIST